MADLLKEAEATPATYPVTPSGLSALAAALDPEMIKEVLDVMIELAREGIEVERPPRPVTIHSFTLMPTEESNVLLAAVECTSGTYIRTLAADLGHLLGGGAHLRNLRRTAVGRFTIGEAAAPDDCDLLPVEEAVRTLDRVDLTGGQGDLVANGRVLPAWEGDGPWALFRPDGTLAAVYERVDAETAKPMVVVPA